jgi:hypothetical protein
VGFNFVGGRRRGHYQHIDCVVLAIVILMKRFGFACASADDE